MIRAGMSGAPSRIFAQVEQPIIYRLAQISRARIDRCVAASAGLHRTLYAGAGYPGVSRRNHADAGRLFPAASIPHP